MKFGDVVKYRDKECVYLVETAELIYLARIPNMDLSKELISRRDKVFSSGSKANVVKKDNIAWCFIELNTEGFRERVAHYGTSGEEYNPEDLLDKMGALCTEDKICLKKEIVDDMGVSRGLKILVNDIVIEE